MIKVVDSIVIRDAALNDIEAIKPLLKSVFDASIFKHMDYNEAMTQRALVTAISFDQGYAKVYEKEGVIKGLLGGLVAENQWGVLCAQDLFMYSAGGTPFLLKDFYQWSKARGAKFVQIADFAGSKRYHKLLEKIGFIRSGFLFIGGL